MTHAVTIAHDPQTRTGHTAACTCGWTYSDAGPDAASWCRSQAGEHIWTETRRPAVLRGGRHVPAEQRAGRR